MRINIKPSPAIFPMPVLMIASYDENKTVDVMNAAWGMMVDTKKIALNLTKSHKTVKNIMKTGYFTVSLATKEYIKEADYFGIVSGNTNPNKFEKSKLTYVSSEIVDAPIINEFPITMECKFIEYQDNINGVGVIGEILGLSVNEDVVENGNIVPEKIQALIYDPFNHGYYEVGKKVGQAFYDGKELDK